MRKTRIRYPLPSIATLARVILTQWKPHYVAVVRDGETSEDDEDRLLDVRLHTFGSDRLGCSDCWVVNFGLSDYDNAHGNAIAGDSIDLYARPTLAESTRIARRLLDDVRWQISDIQPRGH